jgi:hypothetical protein
MKNLFGVSVGEGLAVVFVERALDLLLLFIAGFFGIFLLAVPPALASPVLFSLAAFFGVFALAVALLLKREPTRALLRPFFRAFAPERLKPGIKSGFDDFYRAIATYGEKRAAVLLAGLAALVSWIVVFFQFFLLALALSITLPFVSFALVLPVVLLVEALPVSVGGLGTREAASVVMLGLLGVGAPAAISFSLAMLLFNLVQAAGGFLLFNSLEKPL